MRKKISVGVGVLLAVGLTWGYKHYMDVYAQSMNTMMTYKPVEMIYAGELIEENKIRQVPIPVASNLPTALNRKEDIVGKRAVVPIGEIEQFLPWKVTDEDIIPKSDEEFMSFPMQYVSTINNMVRRGDKVTLWVEYAQPKIVIKTDSGGEIEVPKEKWTDPTIMNQPGATKKYSDRVLDNVRVAYVKTADGKEVIELKSSMQNKVSSITSSQRDLANSEMFRSKPSAMPSYVTLILNKDQYEKVSKAKSEGTLKMGMSYPFFDVGK